MIPAAPAATTGAKRWVRGRRSAPADSTFPANKSCFRVEYGPTRLGLPAIAVVVETHSSEAR